MKPVENIAHMDAGHSWARMQGWCTYAQLLAFSMAFRSARPFSYQDPKPIIMGAAKAEV